MIIFSVRVRCLSLLGQKAKTGKNTHVEGDIEIQTEPCRYRQTQILTYSIQFLIAHCVSFTENQESPGVVSEVSKDRK